MDEARTRSLPWWGWLIIVVLAIMMLLISFFMITDFTAASDSIPGQVLPTIVSTPSA